MQPDASGADDPLILVFGCRIVEPMLDAHRCHRADENERFHDEGYHGLTMLDHDLAQDPDQDGERELNVKQAAY